MIALDLRENCLGFEIYHGDHLATLYRAREEIPRSEVPKPCFAPIYTPSGQLITEYRPPDHPWHTGLFFGWVHANENSLWGGELYSQETKKYECVPNSHGQQRHDGFTELKTHGESIVIQDNIDWLDVRGQPFARECRCYGFRLMEDASGYFWTIETTIEPVDDPLILGATRAPAGYSGLVLRMGPPFAADPDRGASHKSSEGLVGHESIMGTKGRWVTASGADGGSVTMMDHPDNPRHPVNWFTRYNLLGAAPLMEGDLRVELGHTLEFRFGLAIMDEALSKEDGEGLYSEFLATPSLL